VLAEHHGPALEQAAAQVNVAGAYTWGGETYKQVPRGYPADHPRAEWLKYTGLAVFAPPLPIEHAREASLIDAAMGHFQQMAPVYRWLRAALYS
ncbi:MAG: DUF2461 domain-containing protein, partial [Anaerolineae bacterium]|nr:DUF2461 domain-containing protein [Anaerolineae bacterium]